MMLSNGSVKTRNVRVDNGISTETIGRLTTLLNSYVSGLTTDGITLPIIMDLEREMGGDSELISPIIKSIYEVMNEIDSGELKLSGLDRLLQYPEYADTDRFREMLGALEKKDEILNLVSEAKDDDINVIIGSESAVKVMDHSALVFKPIVKNGKTLGAIGVIGPLRMDYAKVLATIAGLSGRLADLINENSLTDGEDKNGRKGI